MLPFSRISKFLFGFKKRQKWNKQQFKLSVCSNNVVLHVFQSRCRHLSLYFQGPRLLLWMWMMTVYSNSCLMMFNVSFVCKLICFLLYSYLVPWNAVKIVRNLFFWLGDSYDRPRQCSFLFLLTSWFLFCNSYLCLMFSCICVNMCEYCCCSFLWWCCFACLSK